MLRNGYVELVSAEYPAKIRGRRNENAYWIEAAILLKSFKFSYLRFLSHYRKSSFK